VNRSNLRWLIAGVVIAIAAAVAAAVARRTCEASIDAAEAERDADVLEPVAP
jgi:hypothetical protein